MKRAVAYLRVSTQKQVSKELDPDGLSLPAQKQEATEKAVVLGVQIVEFYIDRGLSGKDMKRDALLTMMERIRRDRDVDYVIVLSVSRLSRDVGDFDHIWDKLTAGGAELVSIFETIDNTPSGRFVAHIHAAKAEYDRAETAQRVRLGMKRKAEVGGTTGRAPIGYRNVTTMVDDRPVKLVEIDPDRASYIVEAFTLYATGDWGLISLLDHLTEEGLRTRASAKVASKPVALSQLHRMLRNPYYRGDIVVKGVTYPGRHKELVNLELFQRVQDVLTAHGKSAEHDRIHKHPLKGLLWCGFCGARLGLAVVRRKYDYFYCLSRNRGANCPMPYISADAVNDLITRELATWRISPGELSKARASLETHLAGQRQEATRQIRRQEQRLSALEEERTVLLRAHLAGAVPLDLLAKEQDRLTRDVSQAQGMLNAARATFGREEEIFDHVSALLGAPVEHWGVLGSDELRRQVAIAVFERVRITGIRTSEAIFEPQVYVSTFVEAVRGEESRTYYRRVPAGSALAPYEQNPPEIDSEQVLVGAGVDLLERVPITNIWSG